MTRSTSAGRAGFYTTGAALAILFLFPLLWAGWASVDGRPGTGQESGIGLGNYRKMTEFGAGLPTYFSNSLTVSAFTVAFTLVVATLGGYAFGRFSFPGKNALFLVTLAILMVPYATILVPLYQLLRWLSLENTHLGLALVLTMFQLPFAVFMMRNSFEAIPRELEEAALVDGCNTFTALYRILLRAVTPGLVTVGLFAFLASWNEFIAPLVLLPSGEQHTLPVAVFNSSTQAFGAIDYGALEAGVMILAIPCLILFLILQRYYVRGFMSGALRG